MVSSIWAKKGHSNYLLQCKMRYLVYSNFYCFNDKRTWGSERFDMEQPGLFSFVFFSIFILGRTWFCIRRARLARGWRVILGSKFTRLTRFAQLHRLHKIVTYIVIYSENNSATDNSNFKICSFAVIKNESNRKTIFIFRMTPFSFVFFFLIYK